MYRETRCIPFVYNKNKFKKLLIVFPVSTTVLSDEEYSYIINKRSETIIILGLCSLVKFVLSFDSIRDPKEYMTKPQLITILLGELTLVIEMTCVLLNSIYTMNFY